MDYGADKERRAHYRAPQESPPGGRLSAELLLGPGRSYPANLVNASAGGVLLAFPRNDVPALALGTLVEVRFQEMGAARPVIALGQVGHQGRDSDPSVLGLRFTRREDFYAQLTPKLWEVFNRRRDRRVRFRGTEIAARLDSGGKSWEARLFDLSSQGLGVDVGLEVMEELENYELLRIRTEVPGTPLDVVGVRVHGSPIGRDLRVGVRIDPARTTDFGGQQERIEMFLKRVRIAKKTAE